MRDGRGGGMSCTLRMHRSANSWVASTLLLVVSAQLSAQTATPVTTTVPISLAGELRTRSEVERQAGGSGSDLFTYLRARVGVRVDPSPDVRVVLQMQDSRVLGSEGNSAASAADVLELHQGYLEFARPWRGRQFSMRAGRQEVALGNERLVGVVNWSNLGRSFDGVRLSVASTQAAAGASTPAVAGVSTDVSSWTLTMFGATVDERGRRFGTPPGRTPSTDHTLAGLFVTRALRSRAQFDATLLYDGNGSYRRYSAADRGTIDARVLTMLPLGLRAELEGGWQFGHQQYKRTDSSAALSQQVRAWLAGVRVGTRAAATRKAMVTVGADLLSGDATPANGRYSAFATLYGSNHAFYGLNDVIGDPAASTRERGLVDMLATASMLLTPVVTVRGEVHRFMLATGADRPLGSEIDVLLPIRVGSAAGVEFGYSAFLAERGATTVGLGVAHKLRQWAYLQVRCEYPATGRR